MKENITDKTIELLKEYNNIHKLEEMARVGTLKGFDFKVYGGKRNIPHIHIDNKNKSVCIRLDIADYYIHGKSKDIFDAKERDILITFMNSQNEDLDMINYKAMLILWNMNNPNYKVDPNMNMPNYKTIKCK